jgi:hypothetical protein
MSFNRNDLAMIENWFELAKVTSKTHRLEIDPDDGCGWVYNKQTGAIVEYLSTHTFYGSQYLASSKLLQKFGFKIQLANWDAKEAL